MTDVAVSKSALDEFETLLSESFGNDVSIEGSVVKGTIISIEGESALIDVGLKSEGRVALREFTSPGQEHGLKAGDLVEVYVERMEDRNGEAMLSREKARREEAWVVLERAFEAQERVDGTIFGRVKGGFTVDLAGATAFLPGSQVDIRPVKDIGHLLGVSQPFLILKMDRRRGNIVVSRRAVLEESRTEARSELVANLQEGQTLQGVVKNITDYGAFVDLGGVDGLLHVTDIAWRRINHPSEALTIGQSVDVQVIRFNAETQRISLGMKQLEDDPWGSVDTKYPIESRFSGRVTNITDYGAFVELEPGIEGLVHVSEMSWTKKNVHPGKIVSTSQEVEVMILDTDSEKRRISLGLKQCFENPWNTFVVSFPVGAEVEGEVKNITEFGLFIGLDGDIDGMAHLSDLSWEKSGEDALTDFNKGDILKAKVLDVDIEKERISLGIKQLTDDPVGGAINDLKKGGIVTCTVSAIVDNGIEVRVNESIPGFIRKTELSRDRAEQRSDRFAPGEKVDAKITQVDKANRRLTLSIKSLEADEEKKAMAEYGSTDAGASLGEILGAAIAEKAAEADKKLENEAVEVENKTVKKRRAKKTAKAEEVEKTTETNDLLEGSTQEKGES